MLAVVAVLVTVGLIAHLEFKDRRHGQAVQNLLQRIQDPVAAVTQHAMDTPTYSTPAHLPFDDDEAWLKYAEELSGEAA